MKLTRRDLIKTLLLAPLGWLLPKPPEGEVTSGYVRTDDDYQGADLGFVQIDPHLDGYYVWVNGEWKYFENKSDGWIDIEGGAYKDFTIEDPDII